MRKKIFAMLTEDWIRRFGERAGMLRGVRGVAVTAQEVPAPGEGDVDMMVYCAAMPGFRLHEWLCVLRCEEPNNTMTG